MESTSISKLASVLRENGDQVLNANSKLSLNTTLLQNLNDAFASIVESDEDDTSAFQVIKTYNSKVDFLHDVQFLHDFVQKTAGLKLSHNPVANVPIKGTVDISKFRNLKFLELKKVPVTLVKGIQGIRGRLQSLVCIRCVQKLEEILLSCGADHSTNFTWGELREAVFSYNTIESLDTSLECTPWLQIIDLSHNRLRNMAAIECLPNLKYLNISYNLLESVPVFNKFACRKMQVLILKNNYIEDLSALESLENLSELDLSCNCLTDHEELVPLLKLSSLTWLSLEGNPLSFHPKHRSFTVHYLHRKAAFEKFVLDRCLLSKSERLLVGTASSSPGQTRAMVHGDNLSFRSGSSSVTLTKTQVTESQTAALSNKSHGSRKSKQVREAVISENSENVDDETDTLTGSLETSYDHLETKRQIETLRERFGEDKWLVERGGSCVQDVLGLPSGKPVDLTSTLLEAVEAVEDEQVKSSPKPSNVIIPSGKHDEDERFISKEEETTQNAKEVSSEDVHMYVEAEEEKEDAMKEEFEEDDDVEQMLYTVQRLRPGTQRAEELFFAVTERYLKERDAHTGRTRERWAMDTLLSCLRVCNCPVTVQLTFDTIRRDRQEREYIMEDEEAQELVRTLGNILDSRSLSAMNQIPYRCMKCSMQFSHEILKSANTALVPGPTDRKLTCPSCGSTMVIEMDEEPLPAQRPTGDEPRSKVPPVVYNVPGLAKSPSQSSIGSATSLDSPNTTNSVSVVRRYDSDIEVISNPSQSSIEVLEGESRTPGRKRSSEEHQTVPVPHPEPVVTAHSVGQALTLAGLTESSSSGSLTDSVCTTYEHHMPPPLEEKGKKIPLENGSLSRAEPVAKKPLEKTIEENGESVDKHPGLFSKPHSPVKDFTAMFEGLLQSVSSKLMGPATAPAPANATAEVPTTVTYSYTDFSRVDHRIKLFLHQHVLVGEREELVLLLRASVLYPSASPFPGCLVLSSLKVYVLKVAGSEGDDPEQWLIKLESFSMAHLSGLFVLPWNQGIGLEIQEATPKNILFLIQDQQWTSNLLSFLNDAPLPKTCSFRSEPPDYHQLALQELLDTSAPSGDADSTVRVLALFNSCTITGGKVSKLGMGAMIVTASDLIVTQDDLHWLFPNTSAKSLIAHRAQKMNDLIEVELNGLLVVLQFLDEAAGLEELWDVVFQTDSAVQTVVRAIQVPWEQLFSVPLQVTNKTEIVAS
ncbi:serine/threonine-protein kinase 11-interacting protein isoform X2 [Anabrus simplex]|uniref:serine/threonine-protein kinase 11-interacting protein isoform X2 n=1 Tax=Anabrus simplex TaxID=316456 RepID=UPI0035A31632